MSDDAAKLPSADFDRLVEELVVEIERSGPWPGLLALEQRDLLEHLADWLDRGGIGKEGVEPAYAPLITAPLVRYDERHASGQGA